MQLNLDNGIKPKLNGINWIQGLEKS